ncbi:MAG: hypothetical protein GX627_00975 [Parcubacteria group bacterium]|nr:hypothetical protein [Parcubacteria group bacterium]
MGVWFFILGLWSFVWKGISLWKAAQNKSKSWFVFLLVVNTVGVLEILYIYIFSKKLNKTTEEPESEPEITEQL